MYCTGILQKCAFAVAVFYSLFKKLQVTKLIDKTKHRTTQNKMDNGDVGLGIFLFLMIIILFVHCPDKKWTLK